MRFLNKIFIFFVLNSTLSIILCLNPTVQFNSPITYFSSKLPSTIPKDARRKMSFKEKVLSKSKLGNKKLIWSDTVQLTQAYVHWMRVKFDPKKTFLRKGKPLKHSKKNKNWGPDLPGDVIRLTSLKDHAVQYFNNETLIQWQYRSAFFNGNAVVIELFEDPSVSFMLPTPPTNPQTGGIGHEHLLIRVKPKVRLEKPSHNLRKEEYSSDTTLQTLCDYEDRREPYKDVKTARIYPSGCTGWIINDAEGCMLSAGHCFDPDKYKAQVVQMHVPASLPYFQGIGMQLHKSAPQHPDPQYQFMIDTKSLQSINRGDDDMAYFGTFRNPNTGLTYKETANNDTFELPKVTSSEALKDLYIVGTPVRVSGYGITQQETHRHLMLTLQTHVDAISNYEGKHLLEHRVDTEGGNSGSAVVVENTNMAIGIHIHGHCEFGDSDSSNQALLVTHPRLQRYLKAPKGVCKPKQKPTGQAKKKNKK